MCETLNTSARILDETHTINLDGEGTARELVVYDYKTIDLGFRIGDEEWLQPNFDSNAK